MYLVLEFKGKLSNEECEIIKAEVDEFICSSGRNCDVHTDIGHAYIKSQVDHRNDNYKDYGFDRQLTEGEIIEIINNIDDDYKYGSIFEELLTTVDHHISNKTVHKLKF